MHETAIIFGTALDQDDFSKAKTCLHPTCEYIIGEEKLIGPEKICNSYEQNMLEGRAKFDYLEWGKSRIEKENDLQYYVHFTDFLGHKGIKYTHRCKQFLTFNEEGKIIQIQHIDDEEEERKLHAFYKKVDLSIKE